MTDSTPEQEVFNDIASGNRRLVDFAERDFAARAEADKVALEDKKLSVQSTIDDLEISLRKAGRGVREAGLGVAGTAVQLIVYDPRKTSFQTLTQAVTLARSCIALHDAFRDQSDIKEKLDGFREKANASNREDEEEDKQDKPTERVAIVAAASGGPTGGTTGM